MIVNKLKSNAKNQSGIALLVFVIIIALAVSSVYLSSISVVDIKLDHRLKTQQALIRAKEALINYAVFHAAGAGSGDPGEYGYLPCPDEDDVDEGKQEGTCGATGVSVTGYLPWLSLGIEPLKDSDGNCLWYGISGSYKNNPNSGLINEDTKGQFQISDEAGAVITGTNPENRVVAIVFSPGPTIEGQVRAFDSATACGDDYSDPPSAYLEGNGVVENDNLTGVADGLDQFLLGSVTSSEDFNDAFITITNDEIWSAIRDNDELDTKLKALTEQLAFCLSNYAAISGVNRLPWPAPMDLNDYRDESLYNDSVIYSGRFPFDIADSNAAITVGSSDEVFVQGACNMSGLVTVDLTDSGPPASESRYLWNNWKDHFFYVLSKDFEPAVSAASCGADCISVDGNSMAAAVIFSGFSQAAVIKNGDSTGATDTKNDITNYIENVNNRTVFNAATGSGVFELETDGIMFCIRDDLTVVQC